MTTLSRRAFLARASAGVAGAAAVALEPRLAAAALASPASPDSHDEPTSVPVHMAEASVPVVAYIGPGDRAEVTIIAGERRVVRRDPDLARRLLGASR